MGGMNLNNLGAGVGAGVPLGNGVVLDTPVAPSGGNPAARPLPVLNGENVKVVVPTAAEQMVRQAAYETAQNTIKNLCDTPEETAAKQERAKEERDKEIAEEEIDKQVQEQKMRDEIAVEKQEKV